ncbi:MAG: hypothetical protein KF758_15310 [Anaerolineales bacterium]|nr:hypothetical protein [Anaerolineales bacterium]
MNNFEKTLLLKKLLEDEYAHHINELPFHGWHHILFVASKSKEFASEIGADDFLVYSAALTHDLNYLVKKNSHASKGSILRKEILSKADYTLKEIECIEKIIQEASTTERGFDISLEGKALSDADTLFKALPITPIVFGLQYIIENEVSLKELAEKVTNEQNRLMKSSIYFYTDTAKRKYMKWAITNLDLWNNVLESLDDEEVINLLNHAERR